jgi:urea transporter/murein DD-endopeptidase MepM/ murein hydrolase activator NlpD
VRKNLIDVAGAVVNSYAILFFSQSKVLGVLLLLVSFFNPVAGATGLGCVLLSMAIVTIMGYDKESIRMGFYSFNPLLLGIGFGTFYLLSPAFFAWIIIACVIATMLSVTLASSFAKKALPMLSLPFVITFWLLLLAVNSIYHMGLEQRNSAVLNEINNMGEGSMYSVQGLLNYIQLPHYFGLFFRALSAVLFQNSVLAGIIISIGLLIHSRINFSLLVLAFVSACLLNKLTDTYADGISYYHLGSNMIMAAGAIGSFFLIPSVRSYLWALVSIPISFLLINGLSRVFGVYDLPIFSLPFCIVTILFLCFFRLRINYGKMQLTILQHYSPERNLYQYLNGKERLDDLNYFNLNLPFMGVWKVSQGYDGSITHKADWGKALDFVIEDEEHKTYKYPGTQLAHFYCYNKPVLASGDGVIEEVVNHVEDNAVGEVNTIENWGNSVVIKHLTGLYSKVSHLKKNSIKVKPGDFVKQGDMLGMCGNSGRSPEPHLHFQVQTTPYVGSKTFGYPFAYYVDQKDQQNKLRSFKTPTEGTELCAVDINTTIKQAFKFQPGYMATVTAAGKNPEYFEVFTDAFNQSYIYSKTTSATAYFVNNGTAFYFTSFYGDQNSLLYYFYLAAYKVMFTTDRDITVTDAFPLQLTADKPALWLQDLLAPFYQFIKLQYNNFAVANGPEVVIHANQHKQVLSARTQTMEATLHLDRGSIQAFTVNINNTKVEAQWITENTF